MEEGPESKQLYNSKIGDRVLDARLLACLLEDKTTKRNILWATNDYADNGPGFEAESEIGLELVTGQYAQLIRPRVTKEREAQQGRTRDKAEVFTPSWVCNKQNNLVDAAWFGREDVFNIETADGWIPNEEKVAFPEGKTWQKYIRARRLEITCGEAPYLVSRYDTVTGELIPIGSRIGLLDRKLRIVNENVPAGDPEEWIKWATVAFQSTYGFEYQGDNLFLARQNLMLTFIDYYEAWFGSAPTLKLQLEIGTIIAWNIFQMDGLKYVVPGSCHEEEERVYSLLGEEVRRSPCRGCISGNAREHNGIYCRVYDWQFEKNSLPFIDLMKGAK